MYTLLHRYVVVALLTLGACAQDTVVEVTVQGLSQAVTSFEVRVTSSHVRAANDGETKVQTFPSTPGSFAVQLPPGTGGTLRLDVDGRIEARCTIQTSSTEVELVPSDIVRVGLTLLPAPLKVMSASPSYGPSIGGPTITILGQGFGPEPLVMFDGIQTETLKTLQTSPCQITAFLPPDPGALGRVPVTVTALDRGQTDSNSSVFSYYPPRLEFTAGPASIYPAGRGPNGMAMGDVNRDGRLDVAIANHVDNTVSVLLGMEGGTFQIQKCGLSSRDCPTGKDPFSVAMGDVNNDGRVDLVTADHGEDTVSVLLGNGDGTFQARRAIPIGSGKTPVSLVLGDVNGDSKNDLAVANFHDDTVSVLLGNGDGTFRLLQPDLQPGIGPKNLVMGDLNSDGYPDLAVANFVEDTVSVQQGNGDGTFVVAKKYKDFQSPSNLLMADLNGDHHLDLAVANYHNDVVSVLLNSGDGTLVAQPDLPVGYGPVCLAVGDVNDDGLTDLAVGNFGGDTSVLLGRGEGKFLPQHTISMRGDIEGVLIGDLNGDGQQSIVAINNGDDGLWVVNDTPSLATGKSPGRVAVGNLDGDGYLDLAVANRESNTVSVFLGQRHGSFLAKPEVSVNKTTDLAIGNLDGDRHADLVVVGGGVVSVLLGNGDGTFQSPGGRIFSAGGSGTSVVIADLNGDGRQDLAVANQDVSQVSVLLGNGNGTFQAQLPFLTGQAPVAVKVEDVNGDKRLDLVVANQGDDTASVLLGKGDGTFQSKRDFPTGITTDVAIGDFNDDGHPDLAVPGGNAVSVLLGNGRGDFRSRYNYPTGLVAAGAAVGDVNGDGRLDVAVANRGGKSVSVLLGAGDGTFSPRVDFATGQRPISLAIGNINKNRRLDIVVTNSLDNTVTLLSNMSL